METLTINLTGPIREESLQGKKYLVAPVSMIVPGVLNGSKGALFYPPDEVARNPENWNSVPLVLGHPTVNGKPVSARSPKILEQYQLGFVFNATAEDKLRGEAWFDVQRLEQLAPAILTSLRSNTPIELSTGLFTTNEPAPADAVWNGRKYDYIARDYRPDHLAILLNERGACSLSDGCGVLVNQQKFDEAKVKRDGGKFAATSGTPEPKAKTEPGDTKAFAAALAQVSKGTSVSVTIGKTTYSGKAASVTGGTNKKLSFTAKAPGSDKELLYSIRTSDVGPKNVSLTVNQEEPDDDHEVTEEIDLGDGEPTDNAMTKKVGGEELPASAFAYVPTKFKPSTWKLRIDSARHVGMAIAALGKGFRGEQVDIPNDDLPAVKKAIRDAWKKFHPQVKDEDIPKVVANQMSHSDLYMALSKLISDREPKTPKQVLSQSGETDAIPEPGPYVVDVFDKFFVYRDHKDRLWRQGYKTDLRSDSVELDGVKAEVRRVSTFVAVNNTVSTTAHTTNAVSDQQRKAIFAGIGTRSKKVKGIAGGLKMPGKSKLASMTKAEKVEGAKQKKESAAKEKDPSRKAKLKDQAKQFSKAAKAK